MLNLLCTAAEATKVTAVAPSSDSTVFMMQLNCWKPPGASIPGTPAVKILQRHQGIFTMCSWQSGNASLAKPTI